MGIEPTYPAWKAGVLPLNYARKYPYLSTASEPFRARPDRKSAASVQHEGPKAVPGIKNGISIHTCRLVIIARAPEECQALRRLFFVRRAARHPPGRPAAFSAETLDNRESLCYSSF